MDKQRFDEILRAIGMTRKNLADELGVSIHTVNTWVSKGKSIPIAVEKLLECWLILASLEEIFFNIGKMDKGLAFDMTRFRLTAYQRVGRDVPREINDFVHSYFAEKHAGKSKLYYGSQPLESALNVDLSPLRSREKLPPEVKMEESLEERLKRLESMVEKLLDEKRGIADQKNKDDQ